MPRPSRIGAGLHERSDGRTTHRHGTRDKLVTTAAGDLQSEDPEGPHRVVLPGAAGSPPARRRRVGLWTRRTERSAWLTFVLMAAASASWCSSRSPGCWTGRRRSRSRRGVPGPQPLRRGVPNRGPRRPCQHGPRYAVAAGPTARLRRDADPLPCGAPTRRACHRVRTRDGGRTASGIPSLRTSRITSRGTSHLGACSARGCRDGRRPQRPATTWRGPGHLLPGSNRPARVRPSR